VSIRSADPQQAAETWFLHHGLTYFVPEMRQSVREGLQPRRTAPVLAAVVLVALAGGILLAWVSDQVSAAPATLVTLVLLAVLGYGLVRLHAGPILRWALKRTFGSLFRLLPMTTRALPLLLLGLTFLFISTEVWQVSSAMSVARLWLVSLLFLVLGVGFLLVRLPAEVDKADDDVDDATLLAVCAGTPVEQVCRELVADDGPDPASYAEVRGYERWNLVLVLMVIQGIQMLLLALSVFVFLLAFGSLTMTTPVMESWLGKSENGLTVDLVQVSVFLSAFSGLYLTVSTLTDETYRDEFFGDVMDELRRAVCVRAVYLALRARSQVTDGGRPAPPAPAG
jgi:positive regulator of sigma E activity